MHMHMNTCTHMHANLCTHKYVHMWETCTHDTHTYTPPSGQWRLSPLLPRVTPDLEHMNLLMWGCHGSDSPISQPEVPIKLFRTLRSPQLLVPAF